MNVTELLHHVEKNKAQKAGNFGSLPAFNLLFFTESLIPCMNETDSDSATITR